MADTTRLDVALFQRGLTSSRSRARTLIETGGVYVNGRCQEKCAFLVTEDDEITICGGESRFVSRGGYKLLKAITDFSLSLDNLICMDVGASTGGFTDCMLKYGAQKVYAVDVGTDQLAEVLRKDPRVICKEQCNFRYVTREEIPEEIQFASVDVSFISLHLILPVLHGLLSENGQAVCLIKPQFEAGKDNIGKNGVVRNPSVHRQVLEQVTHQMITQGFAILGLTHSPIKGPQGNIEYLAWLQKSQQGMMRLPISPEQVVASAHQELDGEKV